MNIATSFFPAAGALLLTTSLAYGAGVQTAALDGPSLAATRPAQTDVVPLAPMALNSLTNPPAKIATAPVADQSGTVVGTVQKVEMNASGKPTNVDIALMGSNRVVALDSSRLSYDISNNVVTAALDKSQLAQLPAVPQG